MEKNKLMKNIKTLLMLLFIIAFTSIYACSEDKNEKPSAPAGLSYSSVLIKLAANVAMDELTPRSTGGTIT